MRPPRMGGAADGVRPGCRESRESIGVLLDYWWKAECSEAELVGRLEGLRARILGLEVGSVSEVFRVEPVCDSLAFLFMEERGFTLPTAVAEAL